MGESEPTMGGGAEEVVVVWREVDDEEASGAELACLREGRGRVVEVVEDLVDDDEIERASLEWRAVALTQFPALHAETFEIGVLTDNMEWLVSSPTAVGALGEQLQHSAGAGADVEHAAERSIADHVEDDSFDRARRCVQRSLLVPDRGDPLEVLAGGVGAPTAHDVEAFEVGRYHGIGRRRLPPRTSNA